MWQNPYFYLAAVVLIALLIVFGRKFAKKSAPNPNSQDFDNVKDTRRVSIIIFLATLLMLMGIAFGEILQFRTSANQPAGTTASTDLFPAATRILDRYRITVVFGIALYAGVCGIPWWSKKISKPSYRLRQGSNMALYVLVTAYTFLWVSYTGGLTGLYGPAYMALLPVALIVPKSRKVKWGISIPVVLGAFGLAFLSPNYKIQIYMCTLSIFANYLGICIEAHLNRSADK